MTVSQLPGFQSCAVQLQPSGAVTAIEPDPPLPATFALVGFSEYVQFPGTTAAIECNNGPMVLENW